MKKTYDVQTPPNMRVYLAQMCEKFTDTFKKMKELRQMRTSLEDENEQMKEILTEESQKLNTTINKLKDDVTKIQEKRDELLKKSAEAQKMILGLSKEKTLKQEKLLIATDEFEQLRLEKQGILKPLEKIKFVENEISNLKDTLIEIRRGLEKMKEKENALKGEIDKLKEIKNKKEEILKDLEITLRAYEKSINEKTVQDNEIISNYRRNLRENREKMELIEKKEKELDSLSEELETKLERLNTIISNNKVLKNKMIKNDDNLVIYQGITQENQNLRQEISDLKIRIQDLKPNNNNNQESLKSKSVKNLDMTLQKDKNKELNEKIVKLNKILEEKEEEFLEIKRQNGLLNEKKEDFKKECDGEDEKSSRLQEYYEKLSETMETMREKMQVYL